MLLELLVDELATGAKPGPCFTRRILRSVTFALKTDPLITAGDKPERHSGESMSSSDFIASADFVIFIHLGVLR